MTPDQSNVDDIHVRRQVKNKKQNSILVLSHCRFEKALLATGALIYNVEAVKQQRNFVLFDIDFAFFLFFVSCSTPMRSWYERRSTSAKMQSLPQLLPKYFVHPLSIDFRFSVTDRFVRCSLLLLLFVVVVVSKAAARAKCEAWRRTLHDEFMLAPTDS